MRGVRIQGRGRSLRLAAVLAATVLALTGFSRGHGHGHGHSGHGGSGGGCSSSRQDHDSTSSSSSGGGSYSRRPTYRSSPSPSSSSSGTAGSRVRNGKVRLVSCATRTAPYATVEVTNPNSAEAAFTVDVAFQDAGDKTLTSGSTRITVAAKSTVRTRVDATDGTTKDDGLISHIAHCAPDPSAVPANG